VVDPEDPPPTLAGRVQPLANFMPLSRASDPPRSIVGG